MKKIGTVIHKYYDCLQNENKSLEYTGIWQRAAGKNISIRAKPVALKNDTLYVEVEDSVWLYQLTLLKEKIISDFNVLAGDKIISNISFSNKGRLFKNSVSKNISLTGFKKKDSAKQIQKITLLKLPASEQAEVEKIIKNAPHEYRDCLKRLVVSFYLQQQWKKEQGAKICVRCNSLFIADSSKKNTCHICLRES